MPQEEIRCGQAAGDTTVLIEESVTKSNGGKAKVDHLAGEILTLAQIAAKVKTLVDEVKLGSDEQARGNRAGRQGGHTDGESDADSGREREESAATSEELSAQSKSLRAVAIQLAALVGQSGEGTGRHPGRGNVSQKPAAPTPGQPVTADVRETFPL